MKCIAHHRRMAGFTLIELLTVVSIIALLVALLLPVLASARQRVNQIKCMSQLRALAPAVAAYAGANRGFGPPHTFESSSDNRFPRWNTGREAGDGRLSFTGLDPFLGYSAGIDNEDKFYSGTNGCPDYKRGQQTSVMAFTMNHWMLGLWQPGDYTGSPSSRNRWTNLDAVHVNPSRTMIAVEHNLQKINGGPLAPTLTPTLFDEPRSGGGYDQFGRHQGKGLNFLYIDGHAEFLKYNGAAFESLPIIRVD